jgi:tripartite-type tricarboxylate transporter receptor subunit TctC
VSDFAPITWVTRAPHLLVVHPSLPVKSVKELIALAKAKPGALNYNTAGLGSSTNLAAELFRSMAGVNIVRINYNGGGPAVVGLISGEGQMMFATAASVVPHIKTGKLRGVAVTTEQPSALAPGLPTMSASGLPGFEASSTVALLAPAKTPVAIINRLNQEFVRVVNQTDVKEKLFNLGGEVVGSSPERLAVLIKTEVAVWGKVIKDAGIGAH